MVWCQPFTIALPSTTAIRLALLFFHLFLCIGFEFCASVNDHKNGNTHQKGGDTRCVRKRSID